MGSFMPDLKVDWLKLAPSAATGVDGQERGGTALALEAIRNLLGDDVLRRAVHDYLSGAPGAEVARSVLRHVRSPIAADECYRLFLAAASPDSRRCAVELLRSISTPQALAWLPSLLADDDAEIQIWSALMVDDLLMSKQLREEDAAPWLARLRAHPNPKVRELAEQTASTFDL